MLGIALTYGPRTLVAALMLLGGYFAARWAGSVTASRLERYELELPVRALLESAARVLVFALFVIMALQNIGVELLPLIAGLAVAGAAVALAMQGVLGNIAAGFTIIFAKPFRVGDYISIAGVHGEVLEIRLSSTTLGHADLSRVVIPNRKIVGEIVHNYGRVRQLAIEVNVPYEADVDEAIDTARAVLRANSRVLKDPVPGVGIARLADSGVTLGITPWVALNDYGAAGAELNQALLAAYRNRKILRGTAYAAAA
jgi:small conductance mechanosensitive channel